jgi:hypothetical protein
VDLGPYVSFGQSRANLPDGPMIVCLACIDLITRPPVDEVFEQYAKAIRAVEQEHGGDPGRRIAYSVLVFGYEYTEAPLEDIHAAYNRMWARHPDLWETLQMRDLPVSLWMADEAGKPYFAIIQPALGFDFEVLSSRNLREGDRFQAYAALGDRGDFRRAIAVFAAAELSVANALKRVRAQRPSKPATLDNQPIAPREPGVRRWFRRIFSRPRSGK